MRWEELHPDTQVRVRTWAADHRADPDVRELVDLVEAYTGHLHRSRHARPFLPAPDPDPDPLPEPSLDHPIFWAAQ